MNYINGIVCAVILVCFMAGIAHAECYSKAEAEAEQGIRIHSEMMIIGLSCQNMAKYQRQNLYSRYRQFTHDHSDLLSRYEERLIGFYRRNGYRDPELGLHDLRTTIANNISESAARMRPDVFCQNYAGRLEKISNIDDRLLQKWASTLYQTHPVSRPLCNG